MKTLVTYRDNRWRADVGVCRCWRRLVVTGRFIKQRDILIRNTEVRNTGLGLKPRVLI